MRPVAVSVSGVGSSPTIPLDVYISPFDVTVTVVVTGTVNYSLQYTNDDVFAATFNPATAKWFDHASLVNQTTDGVGTIISPIRGVRLVVNSGTGSIAGKVTQAGVQ